MARSSTDRFLSIGWVRLAYPAAIGGIVVLVLGILYVTLVRPSTAGSGRPIAADPAPLSLTLTDVGSGYTVVDSKSGRDEGLWFLQNYPTDGFLGGYQVLFSKYPSAGWVSASVFKYDEEAKATAAYQALRPRFAKGEWVGARFDDYGGERSTPLNIQSFGDTSEGYQSVGLNPSASSILWRRCNVVAVVALENKPENIEDLARIVDKRLATACGQATTH